MEEALLARELWRMWGIRPGELVPSEVYQYTIVIQIAERLAPREQADAGGTW